MLASISKCSSNRGGRASFSEQARISVSAQERVWMLQATSQRVRRRARLVLARTGFKRSKGCPIQARLYPLDMKRWKVESDISQMRAEAVEKSPGTPCKAIATKGDEADIMVGTLIALVEHRSSPKAGRRRP